MGVGSSNCLQHRADEVEKTNREDKQATGTAQLTIHVQVAESERADSDEQSPAGSPVSSPGLFLGTPEGSFPFEVCSGSSSEDEAEPVVDWDHSDSEDEAADGQLDVGAELEGPDLLEGMATADADTSHRTQSHAQVGQHSTFVLGFPAYSASAQALEVQHARAAASVNTCFKCTGILFICSQACSAVATVECLHLSDL